MVSPNGNIENGSAMEMPLLDMAVELLESSDCQALVLEGAPGTGKTWLARQVAACLLGLKPEEDSVEGWKKALGQARFREEPAGMQGEDGQATEEKDGKPGGAWQIVQFHPSYTYEDFIGGIAPKLNDGSGSIAYELKDGIFKKFCDEAAKDKTNKYKYVFIIDEINRADLSAVFGELLYALEYRGAKIVLPSSGREFTIPKNVYLVGTMNTQDKSLAVFDLALRRRFAFMRVDFDKDALKSILTDKLKIGEEEINKYIGKCVALNDAIREDQILELGQRHEIGQAYFAKIANFIDTGAPAIGRQDKYGLWKYHLLPLLEEALGMRANEQKASDRLKEIGRKFHEISPDEEKGQLKW